MRSFIEGVREEVACRVAHLNINHNKKASIRVESEWRQILSRFFLRNDCKTCINKESKETIFELLVTCVDRKQYK